MPTPNEQRPRKTSTSKSTSPRSPGRPKKTSASSKSSAQPEMDLNDMDLEQNPSDISSEVAEEIHNETSKENSSYSFMAPNNQPSGMPPEKNKNVFWMVTTIVLLVLFGAYMLYQYQPTVHSKVQELLHLSGMTGSQQVTPPVVTLPLTLVYDASSIDDKSKIQQFLASLVDPQKGLQYTVIKDTWIDAKSEEGKKYVAESKTKYLPIAFLDSTIEQHPQFKAIQPYLQKNNDHYYFHLYPLEHLETPSVAGGHTKGADPAKAAVTIIEYGSFTCHYCQSMEEVLTKVMKDYPGKISLVYKHFNRLDADSVLAQGAECASDQGKFWQMHGDLFKDQANFIKMMEETKDAGLQTVRTYVDQRAKAIGLTAKTFQTCMDSKKYEKLPQDQTTEAISFGVNGTPAFFVNGKFRDGFYEYEAFKGFIEEAMKAKVTTN